MCESTAYILNNGREDLVLEGVDLFEVENDHIRLINIFGEEKKIKAKIRSLSLVDHKIILESVDR
jgi:predicted RNA-binding protein